MSLPNAFKGVGAVITGIVILALIIVGVYFLAFHTANARGSVSAHNQARGNGAYRNASYEKFFDECNSVKSLEEQIANMKAATGLPASQKSTNLLALTNQRITLINQYNADAAKQQTQGYFRDKTLPLTLTLEGKTTC